MRFKKRPIWIDAYQHDPNNNAWPVWMEGAADTGRVVAADNGRLLIHTLEGPLVAQPGDWIIKGVKGELYPCKPDIFEATYEPAE